MTWSLIMVSGGYIYLRIVLLLSSGIFWLLLDLKGQSMYPVSLLVYTTLVRMEPKQKMIGTGIRTG